MLDRKGSNVGPAGARGSRRPRVSRFHDGDQDGLGTLPIGKITKRTPAKPPHLQQAGLAHACRLGLPSDLSVPLPVPGPLLSPLIGGLPGSSLLISQQAACLQLARIKTQLALNQISSAVAAGSRAVSSTTVSNTRPSSVSTQAPSPTATAINLLNILKVANMSIDPYSPYFKTSNHSSTGSYQTPNVQLDPCNVLEPCHTGASTHAYIGASFGSSINSSNIQSSLHPGTMGYIPGQSKPSAELDSANEIQMKQARENVSQNRPITDCREVSLGFGPAAFSSSTAISQIQYSGYSDTIPSGVIRGTSKLPSSCQTESSQVSFNPYPSPSTSFYSAPNIPPTHNPQFSHSSHSSDDVGNNGSMNKPYSTAAGTTPSARLTSYHNLFDSPSQLMYPANSQATYSRESAMDLLKRFNLQEEDLEELCAYPEEELSPANLPYLLRDIRQRKAQRSSAPFQSSMAHQAQGSRFDPESSVGPGANVNHAEEVRSAFQQPSKVIEYGHTSKYSVGLLEEDEDKGHYSSSFRPSSLIESGLVECSTFQNLQKDVAPVKCGGPLSSHGPERSTNSSLSVCSLLSSLTASPSQRPASDSCKPAVKYPNKEPLVSHSAAPVAKTSATNTLPQSDSRTDHVASAASQKLSPVAGATSQTPALGAKTTTERPAPGAGHFTHKAAGSEGTINHRPFPWTLPKFIPIGQAPPAASVASVQSPPPARPASKGMPTAAMIRDYTGSTPESFPHTCVLCNKPCVGVKDWLDHRKLLDHQASCQLLCRQYSEWEPYPVTLDPADEESQQPPATATVPAPSSSQTSWPSLHTTGREGSARPSSAAPLQSPCGSESVLSVDRTTSETRRSPQRRKSRSKSTGRKGSRSISSGRKRSRSPGRKRSRSLGRRRSRSPGRKRSRSPGRKRSRSPGRRRSRSPGGTGSRSSERMGSRSSRRKRSRSQGRTRSRSRGRTRSRSSGWKRSPNRRPTSGKAHSSHNSRHVHRSRSRSRYCSSSSSSDSSSSPYRYHSKRPSPPSRRPRSGSRSPRPSSHRRARRSSGCRKEESSVEQLAKKLLESSGGHTLTGSDSLEALVKSLAPVLLAELAKLNASSSSSSTSSKDQKKASSSSSSRDEQKPSSSSCRDEKKPSSSSSSRDAKKPTSSSSSRDEKKPSSSSSSRNEMKPSSASSSRDEKKPSSSSSSRDQKKPSSSSSFREEKKPSSSSSFREEKKPSSSSSSRDYQEQPSTPLTGGRKEPSSSLSSSAVKGINKIPVKKSQPTKSEKPQVSAPLGFVPAHPPLLLSGLPSTVTHAQVVSAVEKFGKTRLISLAEDRHVATVYFLQAAAAQALLGFTELKIGGDPITVTRIVGSVSPKLTGNQVSPKPANKALPRNKMTTPGNKIATPGDKTTPAGNMTTTPGNKTITPGNKTAQAGNMTTTPGNMTTTPGNMTTTPGNMMTTPGNMTTTPGNMITIPGNKTTPASNMTLRPGNMMSTSGNKIATPCNKTTPPSLKTSPPSLKTSPPSLKTTPLSNMMSSQDYMSTPVNMTTTLGNTIKTPGNETTPAGNMTTTPGNITSTSGNKIASPSNKITPPGHKTTSPGNVMTTPGKKVTTPGNKTTKPSNKGTMHCNKTGTPESKSAEPTNKAITTGMVMTTPLNAKMSIDTIISSRPDPAPSIPVMHAPLEITHCLLENSNFNPIECIKVRSWTLADCDHDDIQINHLVDPPPLEQAPPSVCTERLPTELFLQSIKCIDVQKWTVEDLKPFANSGGTIMVTDLPTKGSKHREVGPVLEMFSKIKCDKCFILPDNSTAFVEMEANKMEPLMNALANGVPMKSGTARCHLLEENALASPIAFYKQLLKWSDKVYDATTLEYRLVYISNFHTDQDYWVQAFHDGINETGGVRVYLALLGKIFVEFETGEDADRFGLWLSSFRPNPKVKNLVRVTRPGIIPDMEAITPVCTNISHKTSVKGMQPPFWLTVPTLPCLYPTLTPQFHIPAHRTVNGPQDIEWAGSCLTGQSVVMATGLPLGGYTHKDLLRGVWPYFLDKDIPHVFYSVVILPLQRRAFIYFDDSVKCKEFASDYLQKPFTLGGCELTLHFLLDSLKPYDKEHLLFKHLLEWSHVSPKESLCNNQLILTSITYVSTKALKFLFDVMRNSSYVCCIVLANRVIFQYSEAIQLCKVIENLVMENKKLVGNRSISFPKPYRFQTKYRYKGEHMTRCRLKEFFNRASGAYKNKSWPARPSASPQDPSASPPDQTILLGSSPDPPVLSPEVYRFFATAIRQHRQSRVRQEVSQEEETSSEGLPLSQFGGKRSQIFPLPSSCSASSSLSQRSRADGSPPAKRGRPEQIETMEDEDVSEDKAQPPVIVSSYSEVCDSQTKPSNVTKEQEAPSDQQISEEVHRTSSYSSPSREVKSSSSVTACSSSLSEASVSSTSDLPKSSSSSSVPPPPLVVLVSSSSIEPTEKCPEASAHGCEGEDMTQPPLPPRMAEDDGVRLPVGRPTAGPKRGRPPKRTAKNVQVNEEQPTAPVQEEAVVKSNALLENQDSPTRTETKSELTFLIVDSVDGEPNPTERTNTGDKLRGREDVAQTPLRRSSRRRNPALAETRATKTPATSHPGLEPRYQVVDSVGGEEDQVAVEEPPSEEPMRGKRGRKVTGSDAKTVEIATKKKKTTEQMAPPLINKDAEEKESKEEGEKRNPVAETEQQMDQTLDQVLEDVEKEKDASSKARREQGEGDEPKRVCSLSTLVANCYTLPPFTPHNPLGMDHVALKAGFYCKLCSVFYEDENKARTLHCSSLGHYNNLKVYYQRLKRKNLGSDPEAPPLANAPRRL